MPTREEILRSFEETEEEDVIGSSTTVPNVSINEAVKAFETAFNFLEQNDIQTIHEVEIQTPKSKCPDLKQLYSKNQFRPYFDFISTRSANGRNSFDFMYNSDT